MQSQLTELLPVIRVTPHRHVVALYSDGLLMGRHGAHDSLREDQCGVGDREALQNALSNSSFATYQEIQSITVTTPADSTWLFAQIWRISIKTESGNVALKLAKTDGDRFVRALEELAPGIVVKRSGFWRHFANRTTALILCTLLLVFGGLWTVAFFVGGFVRMLILVITCSLLIGGVIGLAIALPLRAWMLRPERQQVDKSKTQPFRSRPLGWTLKIAAVIYLLIFFNIDMSTRVAVQGNLLWWAPAILALYYGYRLSLREPPVLDENDKRRPVLYLRPFEDDNRSNLHPTGTLAYFQGVSSNPPGLYEQPKRWQGGPRFMEGSPARLIRLLFNHGADTSEEQLAGYFRRFGPFVAIGRPGESFVSPGAQRVYVSDDQWRETVLDYLDKSQIVVLQPAKTAGIWWEVEQTLTKVPPERILMCMVNFRNRPNDYEEFRLKVEPIIGHPLPRHLPFLNEYCFLYFESDWTPRLQVMSYRSPLMWSFTGDATDLDYTLTPFIQGVHGGEREPPREPQQFREHSVLASVLMAAFIFVLSSIVIAASIQERLQEDKLRDLQFWAESIGPKEIRGRTINYSLALRGKWEEREPDDGADRFYVFGEGFSFVETVAGVGEEDLSEIPKARFEMLRKQISADAEFQYSKEIEFRGRKWLEMCVEVPIEGDVLIEKTRMYSGEGITLIVITTARSDVHFLTELQEDVLNSIRLPSENSIHQENDEMMPDLEQEAAVGNR